MIMVLDLAIKRNQERAEKETKIIKIKAI